MKVIVTGTAGFLGSFLSEELLANGYEVVGIDNFFRGKKEYLPQHKNFTFYKMDLSKEYDKFYELPKTDLILLIFRSEVYSDIFTTIRRYTSTKWKYYKSLEGERFEVIIN